MTRSLVFSPEADADLGSIYDYIADHGGADRALAYTNRIVARCEALLDFPQQGSKRDDLRADLRILGFERRVTIAFSFDERSVVIDRVLYRGRDLDFLFKQP